MRTNGELAGCSCIRIALSAKVIFTRAMKANLNDVLGDCNIIGSNGSIRRFLVGLA
jgi:hypothetical protein